MVEKIFTDPEAILDKLDNEGDEGITWFTGSEFEDVVLSRAVDIARDAYDALQDALYDVTTTASDLVEKSDGQT